MKLWPALALAALLCGCAPTAVTGSAAGLEGVASMIESVGSTATGFRQTKSAVELNGANKGLLEAQTAMTETQIARSRDENDRSDHERLVTAKLLREMSTEYHDPIFAIMATWVEAGGDPDFAFKYALTRVEDEQSTKVIPQQTLSLKQQAALAPVLPAMHPPQVEPPEPGKHAASHQDEPAARQSSQAPAPQGS